MPIAPTGDRPPRKPLRLWPGVAAVVVQWLFRFGLKAVVPGFGAFARGMMGSLVAAVAIVLWWAFLSRAPWIDRVGALVAMITGVGAAWLLKHESMGPFWLVGYAVPVATLALVASAAASRRLADGPRRATMAAAILLACGVWTLVRTEGIDGDHVATFAWRWAATPEEALLARPIAEPSPSPAAPATATAAEAPVAAPAAAPARPPTAVPARSAVAGSAPTPAPAPTTVAVEARGEWPGFRGAKRDGVVRGVRIETDWSTSPPVELWRRPIGPAWSSFAVSGDRLYTQEQRGDDEIVACYRVSTGQPVWTHRDAARFFESNAGAGPRGTPALSGGRVYTLGATGIVNALDARDGAVVWSRNAAADTHAEVPMWGFAGSPLVVGDAVVVATAGSLVAYDLATGQPRWLGPAGGDGYSSPHPLTIGGIAQVLLLSGSGATSVAASDGTRLWQHRWGGSPIVQPALIDEGEVLITASGESGTRRVSVARGPDGWTASARWTSIGLKPYFNDLVVHEGHAYGFDRRILACINLADGTRTWKGGRYGNGQLVLLPDQDVLLVLSEDGELALVRAAADAFTELARFRALEGKTWNHPVLVGDILLVRNDREMAAFRLALVTR